MTHIIPLSRVWSSPIVYLEDCFVSLVLSGDVYTRAFLCDGRWVAREVNESDEEGHHEEDRDGQLVGLIDCC